MSRIYTGVKILDLTKVFSGPFATRMFADYGAEVIKIENSENPDDSRYFPPLVNGWSGYFEILNRNKRAITLDLKNQEDLQILYNLVKECDVFVENLAPQTKYKLNINYEILREINPKLIYASLSGLGKDSHTKYYDILAQAESGLMSLTGTKEQALKIGPSVVDAFSGMTFAFAIASALYHRSQTGKGQSIDVSMKGAAMNLLESNLIQYSITKQDPERTGNIDNLISPFGVYKTPTGEIAIAIGNEGLWKKFIAIAQQFGVSADWDKFDTNEKRVSNHETTKLIEQVLCSIPELQLLGVLNEGGIPTASVNSMSEVYSDVDNYDRKFLKKQKDSAIGEFVVPGQSIIFSESPEIEYKRAPGVGMNNKEYGI